MRFLIAGLGSIGRRHLKNLIALGESDIILFRTGKSTLDDNVLNEFPVFYDLEEAFSAQPDAVIISNPTAYHMNIAIPAANAGINLMIEKPISHTFDSLMPFEDSLNTSASKVFIAYQFRFNAGLKMIKDLLDSGEMGNPCSFRSIWGEYLPDCHPWEDYRNGYAARSDMGGGVVLTLSHPIDYLRWIFGEVAELIAQTGNRSDLELQCEDFADVELTFKSGLVGFLHLDYYSKPKQHDLEIDCELGTITWDYQSNTVSQRFKNGEHINLNPPEDYERNKMYLDELTHFIDVCKNDVDPQCSYYDGKQALNICIGILQSGRYKDRVIFEDK